MTVEWAWLLVGYFAGALVAIILCELDGHNRR